MTEHEVSFPHGELRLAGSLRTCHPAPAPAALLISGSGPIDRNSNGKRMPLGVAAAIADDLAARGVATLRYDKRGIGASGGDYRSAGMLDNIDDARAALAFLRDHPDVDADQVVVIGHSEGALIAAELAADPTLAGVVLLAGAAQTGRDVLEWQARQIAPTLPAPVRALLRLLRQDLVRTQAKRLDRLAASSDDVIRLQGVRVNARWFREFMAFDPAVSLEAIAVPTLAITGAKDVQVDCGDIAHMNELVPHAFTGHVLDDLSHLLRHDPTTAGVRNYKKQMRQPMDPRVLDLLGDWITEQLNASATTNV